MQGRRVRGPLTSGRTWDQTGRSSYRAEERAPGGMCELSHRLLPKQPITSSQIPKGPKLGAVGSTGELLVVS